ncbi:MAG: CHAT domain-containing protein [Acidobacteriota bacterium]
MGLELGQRESTQALTAGQQREHLVDQSSDRDESVVCFVQSWRPHRVDAASVRRVGGLTLLVTTSSILRVDALGDAGTGGEVDLLCSAATLAAARRVEALGELLDIAERLRAMPVSNVAAADWIDQTYEAVAHGLNGLTDADDSRWWRQAAGEVTLRRARWRAVRGHAKLADALFRRAADKLAAGGAVEQGHAALLVGVSDLRRLGRLELAWKLATTAVERAEALADDRDVDPDLALELQAAAYDRLARVELDLRALQSALGHYRRALALDQQRIKRLLEEPDGSHAGASTSSRRRCGVPGAQLPLETVMYEEACAFDLAPAAFTSGKGGVPGSVDLARRHRRVGVAHLQLGDFDDAIHSFQCALHWRTADTRWNTVAGACQGLADAMREREELNTAQQILEVLVEQPGSSADLADRERQLGLLACNDAERSPTQRLEAARAHLARSLAHADHEALGGLRVDLQMERAELELSSPCADPREGDLKSAARALADVASAPESVLTPARRAHLDFLQGHLAEARGDLETAAAGFAAAARRLDRLLSAPDTSLHRAIASMHRAARGRDERVDLAARARVYREAEIRLRLRRGTAESSEVSAALAEETAAMALGWIGRSELWWQARRAARGANESRGHAALSADLAGDELAACGTKSVTKADHATGGDDRACLDALRARLPDDTTALVYWYGESIVYAWALRRERVHFASLERLPLDKALGKLQKAMQPGAEEDEFDEPLDALSAQLLEPFSDSIDASERLLVVLDGPLHGVPVCALRRTWRDADPPLGGEPAPPLIASHRVERTASLPVHLAAPQRLHEAPGAERTALLVAPFYDGSNHWRPLDGPEREVAELALRLEPAAEVEVLRGDAATKSAFLDALPSARWVHFAGHADGSLRHADDAVLALSPGPAGDRELRAAEIASLELSAELVVLAACRSGLGEELDGEGLFGVARAMRRAGARAVVSTLWQIDDEATVPFVLDLYDRLLSGASPSSALRQTQIEAARRGMATSVWAAFVLEGDGAPPLVSDPSGS